MPPLSYSLAAVALVVAATGLCGCAASAGTAGEAGAVRALVVAADAGNGEPRHAADALMQYRLLRERGLTDDEIVLALPDWAIGARDDVPTIRAEVGGPDLRRGARIDLAVSDLDPGGIAAHLDAEGASLRAYVYLSGHGDSGGMRLPGSDEPLDGAAIATALDALRAERGDDVALTAVVEACEPDSFLDAVGRDPDATVLSASERGRPSFAAEYDRRAGVWLSDRFTLELTRLLAGDPPRTVGELLDRLRRAVPDSVPQLAGDPGASPEELVPAARAGR